MNYIIQSELKKLSLLTEEHFMPYQKKTINQLIDAGEWGIAAEIISDILHEYEFPISSETYQLIKKVSLDLNLEDATWSDLSSQVLKQ